MTEKSTKKTVVKASAGKQVKAAPAKAGKADEPAVAAKTAKAPAVAKAPASTKGETGATKAPKAATPKAAAAAKPIAAAVVSTKAVPMDAVARKAYEIFISEGCQHGRDQEHWFRAEAELSGASI